MPLGPSRAALVVVDVSGHGADAGVFALRAKDLTLAAIESGYGPGEALAWVAARLGDTDERFLTGVMVEIDDLYGRCATPAPATRRCWWPNGAQ